MKAFKFLIIFMIISLCTWIAPQKSAAQDVSVSFQVFYDDLSPYGTWIDNPTYGYVWIPSEPGFYPYATNGYWAYTDYGWTWVSYYPWGWAPFHYGRWYEDPLYGPVWIPDEVWGPAWVDWRFSDGYYGWCPMGPGSYHPRDEQWRFVEVNNFGSTTINNYYVSPSRNTTIIQNSTVVNNPRRTPGEGGSYNAGPERTEVERRTGKPVTPIAVKEAKTPTQKVDNGQLEIYKPQRVAKTTAAGQRPAPPKVASPTELKTIEQKKAAERNSPANQKTNTPANQSREKTQEQKTNPPANEHQRPQPKTNQPSNQPQEKTPQQQRTNPPANERQKPQQQKQPEQPRANPPVNQPQHQEHPQAQPQEHPQAQPQEHPQAQPQEHPQAQPQEQHPQAQPQEHPQAQPQEHPQVQPQEHPQPQPQPRPEPQPRPQPQPRAPHTPRPR